METPLPEHVEDYLKQKHGITPTTLPGKQRARVNYKQIKEGWRIDEITVEAEVGLDWSSLRIAEFLEDLALLVHRDAESVLTTLNDDHEADLEGIK